MIDQLVVYHAYLQLVRNKALRLHLMQLLIESMPCSAHTFGEI